MIYYLGNTLKNFIPAAIVKKRNKAKSWTYGYDEEYDLIVISRDGTLGEVIYINGLNIGLPAKPKESDIINYNKPSKDQKWNRINLPDGLNADTQFEKRYIDFIEREWKRREEGVFIYVKGELMYLTGTAYFFFNYVKLEDGYANFRVIQNELMLYWEACKADQRSYGICYVKNRRFGWSSICDGELLDSGTRTENSLLGIISKTGEDAKSMFNKLIRAFRKLPSFFTPVWDGTTSPKRELILSEPTRKRGAATKNNNQYEGLDTLIKWYSTVLNAMDGERVFRSALDETGKFPKETPFDKYWSIVKTSHRIGARIVGKSMVGSTVNAMSKGGAEFKKVYYQSDPLERSKNGQTQSGLYKLFIPAQYCIDGFFDEYGFSIADDPEKPVRNEYGELKKIGANTYLDNELEALKDQPEEYNEFLRQFPREEVHAFRDEASDCKFDLAKLYEQMDYNEHELPAHTIQRGNFHWKDGVQDSEVIWSPCEDGRFLMTYHPPKEFRNQWEWRTFHGVTARSPLAAHLGAFGCDPYNRSQTVKKVGSKGSIHLSTKFHFIAELPTKEFILEYIDRPSKVEYFFEDMIMAMVYWSMPVAIELSNENFLRYLKERGYRHYILNRPNVKWKDLSPTEKEFGGLPPQDNKIGDAQFYAVEAYITDYVGVSRDNSKRLQGEMGSMPFNRTLTHWKDVDPANRTKYDAYISSSLSLIANQPLLKIETAEQEKRVFRVSTYNNSGSISELVKTN